LRAEALRAIFDLPRDGDSMREARAMF